MRELIEKVENLARRVIKLETNEEVKRYGTAFPSSPFTGQRYFRTDRGIEYYYDGTRWLSMQLFMLPLTPGVAGIAATTLVAHSGTLQDETYQLYATKLVLDVLVATTFDATNTWKFQLNRQDNTGANSTIGANTDVWAAGQAINIRYLKSLTVNTVYDPATTRLFYVSWTKVNAPGNLTAEPPTLQYRLIG